jgi:hypothetical protein
MSALMLVPGRLPALACLACAMLLCGCAADEPLCGGSFESEAQMERVLGIRSSAYPAARTIRY